MDAVHTMHHDSALLLRSRSVYQGHALLLQALQWCTQPAAHFVHNPLGQHTAQRPALSALPVAAGTAPWCTSTFHSVHRQCCSNADDATRIREGPGPHVGTPAREELPPERVAVAAVGHGCPGPCTPLVPPPAPAPPTLTWPVTTLRSAPLGVKTACMYVAVPVRCCMQA